MTTRAKYKKIGASCDGIAAAMKDFFGAAPLLFFFVVNVSFHSNSN